MVLDQIFMDHLIKIIGGYPGLDGRGSGMHGLCSEPASDPHSLDDLVRLDVIGRVGIGRESPHIVRPRNAGWHLTQGRYGRGLDGHLAILRSEKVVANNINWAELMWLMTGFRDRVCGGVPSRASVRRSPEGG